MVYKTPEKVNEFNYRKEGKTIASMVNEDVVLDLIDTQYISSAGIQAILYVAKTCSEKECNLSLINPQPIVDEILHKLGLNYLIKEEDKNKELIK